MDKAVLIILCVLVSFTSVEIRRTPKRKPGPKLVALRVMGDRTVEVWYRRPLGVEVIVTDGPTCNEGR